MTVILRQAGADDAASLMALVAAHAAFEHGHASITPEELHAMLSAPRPEVGIIVAATPSELVGYAALTMDFSLWRGRRWAHLDCLFVHQQHRGHSIGQRLFNAAKSMARSRGADSMEWQTPLWNKPAIRFYAAQGAAGLEKMRFSAAL